MGEQVGGVEMVSSRVQVRPTGAVAAWTPGKIGGTGVSSWEGQSIEAGRNWGPHTLYETTRAPSPAPYETTRAPGHSPTAPGHISTVCPKGQVLGEVSRASRSQSER